MKNFLKRLVVNGVVDFVPEKFWAVIRTVNLLALAAFILLFAKSTPPLDTDTLNLVLFLLLQLAIVVTIHIRADETKTKLEAITKHLAEIDEIGAQRTAALHHHVELVAQDVHWLLKRKIRDEEHAALAALNQVKQSQPAAFSLFE